MNLSAQRGGSGNSIHFKCLEYVERAHRQEQACEREHDERDLVDVLFAGRQSAYEVRSPEHRVIPQGESSPPLTASVRDRGPIICAASVIVERRRRTSAD